MERLTSLVLLDCVTWGMCDVCKHNIHMSIISSGMGDIYAIILCRKLVFSHSFFLYLSVCSCLIFDRTASAPILLPTASMLPLYRLSPYPSLFSLLPQHVLVSDLMTCNVLYCSEEKLGLFGSFSAQLGELFGVSLAFVFSSSLLGLYNWTTVSVLWLLINGGFCFLGFFVLQTWNMPGIQNESVSFCCLE